jgi:hypothetical protein
MEITKHQDRAIAILGKRVSPGALKVHLPERNPNPPLGGEGTGAIERIPGDIATDHFQPALGHQNPVVPVPAREIQYRPRQGSFRQQPKALQQELRGLHCLGGRVHGTIRCTSLLRVDL